MVSFADLKRNRKEDIQSLTNEIEKINTKTPSYQEDKEKYWELTVDKKTEIGQAVIRFLPAPVDEKMPFTRYWEHGFKGPAKENQKPLWYIEKSLTTINQPDPCSEYNAVLWETGIEENQKIVRDRKRKLIYVSNIYVVKDFANPENNGKVFLFRYGKKIFDKINEAMKPTFEGVEPINPFDLWEGANFQLRAAKVDGYRSYEKSVFGEPSPLSDDDDVLEAIWKSEHSLEKINAPETFKTYEQLKARLDKVLRINSNEAPATETAKSSKPANSTAKFNKPSGAPWLEEDDNTSTTGDEEDDEDFFKKLRNTGGDED